MVVDDGGDATVGVDLQKLWALLLFLAEIEIHGLVRQSEFFEDGGDFPKSRISFQTRVVRGGSNIPAVGSTIVGVQGKLLSVRHGELVMVST